MSVISSTKNDKVKIIRSLSNKKGRVEYGLFIAEGLRLVREAVRLGKASELIVNEKDEAKFADLFEGNIPVTVMKDFVFDSVSDTLAPSGIMALCKTVYGEAPLGDFVLVADNIRDAGNMGTLIRTAAAMGVTDVVALNSVDFYNPKTVRGSMGGVFETNLVAAETADAERLLKGYRVCALDMDGADVFTYAAPQKIAVCTGNEADGLSETIKRLADDVLSVPMKPGAMESLNAAVAASVALAVIGRKRF